MSVNIIVTDQMKNIQGKIEETERVFDEKLSTKVSVQSGKGLSSNDFTDEHKVELEAVVAHKDNLQNPHGVSASQIGAPFVSSGSGVPNSVPAKIGDIYIDTAKSKTYIAKGVISSADWVKQNGSYSLQMMTRDSLNPVDSSYYYFGFCGMMWAQGPSGGINGVRRCYITKSGVISGLIGTFYQGLGASAESSSIYIRLNNTTDYLVSNSVLNNVVVSVYQNFNLNIPVSAGDYVEIKWETPAWATNPTGVYGNASISIDL